MNKLKLIGLGNNGNRSYFIFKKDNSFFSLFPTFLKNLGLNKLSIMYENSEEPQDINKLIDTQDNTRNNDFDLDIFYGKNNFIVVVRTRESNRDRLMTEIKKIADYPGFG
ncbi:MAG: hypothetical protein GWP09_01765 [Nitrospiraceae bacterium]|nr:hypothetical protein [Nitrospiraceae bacterium]